MLKKERMRSCTIYLAFYLLANVSYAATDPPFTAHLDGDESGVEFRSSLWMLEGLHPQGRSPSDFHIHVRYRTLSERGRLLSVLAENAAGNDIFIMSVDVVKDTLAFELSDMDGNLLSHGSDSEKGINDGQFHDLNITYVANQTIVGINKGQWFPTKEGPLSTKEREDLDIRITLGKFKIYEDQVPSIVGCVSLINVGNKQNIEVPETVHEIEVSKCPDAETPINKPNVPVEDGSTQSETPNANVTDGFLRPDGGLPIMDVIEKIGEGATFDNKNPLNGIPLELFCQPRERTLCENSKSCVKYRNSTEATCICKPGYGGKYCQFSLFPRSCYDAFVNGDSEPGVYEIDVDGSGPFATSFVECGRNGVTIVTHNVPERAIVRSPEDTSSKSFPVSYKLFSSEQLKELIRRSERCEQVLKYECHGAPLDFAKNMTWFTTVFGKELRQIGTTQNACVCKERYGCNRERNCNCDDPNAEDIDEGYFSYDNAGIAEIFVRRHQPEGTGRLTLSPLECYGDAGHVLDNALTVKSRSASAIIEGERDLQRLEFDFRTNQSEIDSLVVGTATNFRLKIGLTAGASGHRIELLLASNEADPMVISILSQAKLNDLKWHRIIVEILREEVRLTVDRLNTFAELNKPLPAMTLWVGAEENQGFIGCVRNFHVNNDLITLYDYVKSYPDKFASGCPNLCGGHACEQDSRCIEHFDTGSTSCECRNKFIHFGDRCEKNVNKNSEVSFHDRTTGFLKFLDEHLEANPLNSNIVFSARTDQKRALFLYAHDQFDNFIQVYLADEYRIVLILNNQSDVRSCTLFSSNGKEFSDMRWLQFVIEQTPTRVTLTVNDEICEIPGNHFLSQQRITSYSGELEDAILPPQPAGPVVAVQPYHILFVGGVPRVQQSRRVEKRSPQVRDEEAADLLRPRVKRQRIAYYVTDIPPLLGCMRGFMLNNKVVDLKGSGIRPQDPDAVRNGCHNDCETLLCNNGGHCTVHWQNYDPRNREQTGCDCSKTSYYGPNCLKDTGVHFTGMSSVVFNMTEPKRFFLHESEEQTLQFAFVPVSTRLRNPQRLATAYFSDGREFQVVLSRNGSVNVGIVNPSQPAKSQVYTFAGNFTDGYRHFFQATFSLGRPALVLVDAVKRYLDVGLRLHLADVDQFYFGGGRTVLDEEGNDEGAIETDKKSDSVRRYRGCFSNVDIDFHKNEAIHFRPLLYYLNPKELYHNSLFNDPPASDRLSEAQCAGFQIPGVLPTRQRNVQFPVWEAVFSPVVMVDPITEAPKPEGPSLPLWVWLVLLVLLLLLLLCCFACYRVCCRSKKNDPPTKGGKPHDKERNGKYPDEITPLNNELGKGTLPKVADNFNLPPADEPLFRSEEESPLINKPPLIRDSPPLRRPPSEPSSKKENFSEPEDPDENDEEDEATLMCGYDEQQPDILDENTMTLIDRSNPSRMSSFGPSDRNPPPKRSPLSRSPPVFGQPKPVLTPSPPPV